MVLSSGCRSGGDGGEAVVEPLPTDAGATSDESLVSAAPVVQGPGAASWVCDTMIQHVSDVVNTLAASRGSFRVPAAVEVAESVADVPGPVDPAVVPEGVPVAEVEAVRSATGGLSDADYAVFNQACDLQGLHSEAKVHWDSGNKQGACDAWRTARPAAQNKPSGSAAEIAELNIIVGKMWMGATANINEGLGRCRGDQIASRAIPEPAPTTAPPAATVAPGGEDQPDG